MARKKSKAKPHSKNRRRIGAINKSLVTNILFAAVGGVAAKFASGLIKDVALTNNSDTDNKIKSALPLLAGGLLAATIGKKDAKFMYLGLGMAAVGASNLASELGIVSGLDNMIAGRMSMQPTRMLNGYTQPPRLAGSNAKQASICC